MGVKDAAWESKVNPNPPNVNEGTPRGAKPPVTRPNSPDSMENRVLLGKSGPASGRSTFTAPRKEPSKAPFDCGYTSPGKM